MIRRFWRWLGEPSGPWTRRDWVFVIIVATLVIVAITIWPFPLDLTAALRSANPEP
jgi:uncharacterized membrane protein YhaH (DUF805 family)